ncbi:hypothetical protein M758_4G010200 [Ceratodon purpureus]|uniref:Uncharacterized protein n=1 Tax=Ceratodon purpureus TaxID=3225 RepID=A0A8T0I5H8_CERPU|nr:hypothetical protein KC19_4G010900 [Ceratodon purpureus]KAG0617724.1 hypothetical protein M758_4G010200 [Ceratodon purpureus]
MAAELNEHMVEAVTHPQIVSDSKLSGPQSSGQSREFRAITSYYHLRHVSLS